MIWYDLDEPMWTTPAKSDGKKRKRRTTMEVYDFEFEFRRDKAADAVAGRPLLPPVRIADCASCGWRERCNVDLEAGTGDPSLLPRVGYRQWRTLKDAGITNRAGSRLPRLPDRRTSDHGRAHPLVRRRRRRSPYRADRHPPPTSAYPNPDAPRRRHLDSRRATCPYPFPDGRTRWSRLPARSNPQRPGGTRPRTPLPTARRRPAGNTSSRRRDRHRHGKRSRRRLPVGRPSHRPSRNRAYRDRLPTFRHLGSAHNGHRVRELPPLLGLARHTHHQLHSSWRLRARLLLARGRREQPGSAVSPATLPSSRPVSTRSLRPENG